MAQIIPGLPRLETVFADADRKMGLGIRNQRTINEKHNAFPGQARTFSVSGYPAVGSASAQHFRQIILKRLNCVEALEKIEAMAAH
jgi:hypothetical protein